MTPASWAWIGLASTIVLWVVIFDVWAHFAHRWSMSGQFHQWLHGEITGPLVVGLVFGLFAGLAMHLIITKAG